MKNLKGILIAIFSIALIFFASNVDARGRACDWCGGSGDCPNCDGSGICKICDGSGHDGGAFNFDTNEWEDFDCRYCHGSGECSSCDGSGECYKCHGSGYLN